MGAGSSRAALQNQPELYGTLKLDKKQQTNLVILSDLITMVVEKNNLFNLSDLLSTSGGCNKLLILLESKLKQEFTALRFPDPDQPSTLSVVDYLPLKEYEYYQKTPAREALCKDFAFFIVRFTTLLSALVASVAYQPNIATEIINNLDISSTASALPSLPFTSVVGNPIQGDIIKFLGNNLYRVPNDSRPLYYFKDESKVPIFVLDASSGLVYRVDQPQTPVLGITIRLNDGSFFEPSPWTFNPPYRSSTYTSQAQLQPFIMAKINAKPYQGRPIPLNTQEAFTYNPIEVGNDVVRLRDNIGKYQYILLDNFQKMLIPNVPYKHPYTRNVLVDTDMDIFTVSGFSDAVPVGGYRKSGTRVAHRRKQHRMTKKRRTNSRIGGAGPEFQVQFYNVLSCSPVQAMMPMQPVDVKKLCPPHGPAFLMDERGNTWEKSAEPGAFPQKLPFNERVAEIFKTVADTVVLKADTLGSKAEAVEMFRRLNTLDPDTYAQFQTIQHLIMGKDTSNHTLTSPAFYRALLLITSVQRNSQGSESINTLFCDDKWTGRMTSIAPYALLQALYYDIAPTAQSPTNISSQAKSELTSVVISFRTNNIAKDYIVAPAQQGAPEPANTLSQLQFVPPSKIASIFCSKEPSGFRTTNVPNQMIVLKNTYNTLQQLYNTHLSNVIQLVRKVLSLQQGEFQKAKRISLRPIFVTSPDGAQRALEGFIAEGRALLAKHYLDVETAYKAALVSIQKLGEGTL